MKKLLLIFFILYYACCTNAQIAPDTALIEKNVPKADDPSEFFTRIEVFNELQYHEAEDLFYNKTILRTIVKIGKRFTTRLDLPFVYNSSTSDENYKQSGLGDISFRLLGFKFLENPKSALAASIEISMNTAQSPYLGTGKNMLIPMVSYTKRFPKEKMLLAMLLQQVISVSGDKERSDINYSKLELIFFKAWSGRFWTALAPEWYFDYVDGGVSMNVRTRLTYAPTPRLNIWATPSAGIFGDFIARYQWSAEIGCRYYLFKELNFKKKSGK
jgi:hypothetical protein